jgi:hypothetical protein
LDAVRGIQQADLKAVEPQVKNDSARSGRGERGRRWARPRPSVEGEVTASNAWKFPTFFTRCTKPFASIRYTVVYADVLRAGISFRISRIENCHVPTEPPSPETPASIADSPSPVSFPCSSVYDTCRRPGNPLSVNPAAASAVLQSTWVEEAPEPVIMGLDLQRD